MTPTDGPDGLPPSDVGEVEVRRPFARPLDLPLSASEVHKPIDGQQTPIHVDPDLGAVPPGKNVSLFQELGDVEIFAGLDLSACIVRLVDPPKFVPPQIDSGPSGPSSEAIDALHRARRAALEIRATDMGVTPGLGSTQARSTTGSSEPRKTVSQPTLSQYNYRANSLMLRYRRERGVHGDLENTSMRDWVNWLLSLKPTVQASTWRIYRTSVLYYLQGFPSDESPEAIGLLEADIVQFTAAPGTRMTAARPGAAKQTSALKEKRIPFEDFDRLTTALRHFSRSKFAPTVVDWLRAGILTGLRPVEWRACDLEIRPAPGTASGRYAWLYVLNAKATNGRGNGVIRTLDLSGFAEDDLNTVARMVDRGRRLLDSGQFAFNKNACSRLLYETTVRLWPRRRLAYSLYSARHQAIANWKSMMSPVEICALVGHNTTKTASEHYGKKRSSWPSGRIPTVPAPVPDELARIQQRFAIFEERVQLAIRAGLQQDDLPEWILE